MAAAGALVAARSQAVASRPRPGVPPSTSTRIAESSIRDGGGIPSFLGYHGFPATICSSVNDRVVHGIPSATEVLAAGDLVSIDCGAILDGWHGDSAVTFGVGALIPADEALSEATRGHVEAGIAAMVPGNRLTDVSHAIEVAATTPRRATAASTASSRATAATASAGDAHGPVPAQRGRARPRARTCAPGSVLAIEPMLTLGTTKTIVLDDEWTVVTADGTRAAHWEHTVAVTDDGPRILTLPAG